MTALMDLPSSTTSEAELKTIRDIGGVDILGIADPLACKGHVPERESQNSFDETKAWGVTALREFDLRSRVVQLVVIFNAFWLEKLTGYHGFAYPSVVVVG